jgi:hypothetical protein
LDEYDRVRTVKENFEGLSYIVLRELTKGLSQLTLLILAIGFSILLRVPSNLWLIYVIAVISYMGTNTHRTFNRIWQCINNSIYFDKFKEKIVAKIKGLGENFEELMEIYCTLKKEDPK